MASLFEVLAHDDSQDKTAFRKAAALASTRLRSRFANYLATSTSQDEFDARLSLVGDDVQAIVAAVAEEYGVDNLLVYKAAVEALVHDVTTRQPDKITRTASVHEARKPKMCPYHSEVVDISLADGSPSAGYNAMAQHAWGSNHCQGGEYEGGKCNFKPAMTTQTYWDDKAEKAEQRKQERAERLDEPSLDNMENEGGPTDEAEPINEVTDLGEPENDGPVNDPVDTGETQVEAPMLMAASTRTADGGPVPKMDKRKWTPTTVPALNADDSNGRHPTKHKDIVKPIKAQDADKLTEIGEQVTEHQDVTQGSELSHSGQGGSFPKGRQADPVTSAFVEDPRSIIAKYRSK